MKKRLAIGGRLYYNIYIFTRQQMYLGMANILMAALEIIVMAAPILIAAHFALKEQKVDTVA